jgi:hypothetical protein
VHAQDAYHLRFENDVVAMYQLDLVPQAAVRPLLAMHDSFWISLSTAEVTFSREQDKLAVQLNPGDVHFFSSFETNLVTNSGHSNFRGVLVVLKPRALISAGCECNGNTARTICGCKGATHLEPLWALSLGEVTLAGTSLAAGEGFRAAAPRDDMLLVAVTDVELEDAAARTNSEQSALKLSAGQAAWIPQGRHQFRNTGDETARFVTIEF